MIDPTEPGYRARSSDHFGWSAPSIKLSGYDELVEDKPRHGCSEPNLLKLISDLRCSDFVDRAIRVRHGREVGFLSSEWRLRTIAEAIRGTDDADKLIERVLDDAFQSLSKGKLFDQIEFVMGILYSLKMSGSRLFETVARLLAATNSIEIGRLRPVARALLQ